MNKIAEKPLKNNGKHRSRITYDEQRTLFCRAVLITTIEKMNHKLGIQKTKNPNKDFTEQETIINDLATTANEFVNLVKLDRGRAKRMTSLSMWLYKEKKEVERLTEENKALRDEVESLKENFNN